MQLKSKQIKPSITSGLLIILSFLLYVVFSYDLFRTDYIKLLTLYSALFFLFYKLVQLEKSNLKLLTWIAFAFRAVFILSIPNLSQDFYRFLWDGRLLLEGLNPYLSTPELILQSGETTIAQAQELRQEMGDLNATNYSNYTPLNQLLFVLAALFSSKNILGSVVVLRLIIIVADFGTLYYGRKLLEKLKLPSYNIFWFILNPLIIIEFTGNLHFEGVMIFFLVWSLYLLHNGKWYWAALAFGLSVSVKLIPLLFLPLFYQCFMKRSFGISRLILFYFIVGLTTITLFLPFLSEELINNYSQTLSLYFQKFEFNASMYYIAREIGYVFRGWNEIAIIGKVLPIIVLLFVLIISFFRDNKTTPKLLTAMLFAIAFYFFMATTVHPWYITTILAISVFTNYKFPLVWSFVIIFSYLAYAIDSTQENIWIVTFEYVILYGMLIWELTKRKVNKAQSLPIL